MSKRTSGIALLIVLMSLALISFFIAQLMYTSRIDITITKKTKNRLQSYYLAQSAARMGLLRIHMYREVENLMQSQKNLSALVPKNVRQMVWSFPLPAFPLDGQKSESPGTFMSIVRGEGSKIPINLIDEQIHRMPPSIAKPADAKSLSDSIKKQIQDLLDLRAETDDPFAQKLKALNPNAIPESLADWIDSDDRLIQGGDEDAVYQRKDPPYKPRNDRFGALSEVSMIDLWDDDVLAPLRKEFSLINMKSKINCNTITLERLNSFAHNELTASDLSLIEKHRLGEPFNSLADCELFIKTNPDITGGANFTFPPGMKDQEYDKESVFVVEGSSIVGDSRSIVRLYVRIDEQAVTGGATGGITGGQTGGQTGGDTGGGTPTPPDSKFQDLHVIRFEEGAAP